MSVFNCLCLSFARDDCYWGERDLKEWGPGGIVPSMEPGGSADMLPAMGSQKLQGVMLTELLEAWPVDAWIEAGQAAVGIK